MKKILLLLMVMFTLANCSFAENWVYFDGYSNFPSFYIDIDSIKFGCKSFAQFKIKISNIYVDGQNYYVKYDASLSTGPRFSWMNIYDKDGNFVEDYYTPHVIDEFFHEFFCELYEHPKELLARNIIISFETVLILSLFIYWRRMKKNAKIIISEYKESVEESENN